MAPSARAPALRTTRSRRISTGPHAGLTRGVFTTGGCVDIRSFVRTAALTLLVAVLTGVAGAAHALTVEVKDGGGRPLADAVVILHGAITPAAPAAPPAAVMRQVNKSFVPYVLAVAAGTAVSFPNEDDFLHHVYSFAQAKTFDLKLYGGGEVPQVRFEQPGVIGLGCNIHDAMRGYIVVSDSPWFAVTGADGRAQFAVTAARGATLEVWHQRLAMPPALPALADPAGLVTVTLALKPGVPRVLDAHEAGDY